MVFSCHAGSVAAPSSSPASSPAAREDNWFGGSWLTPDFLSWPWPSSLLPPPRTPPGGEDWPAALRRIARNHFGKTLCDVPFLPAAVLAVMGAWRLGELRMELAVVRASGDLLAEQQEDLQQEVRKFHREPRGRGGG